MVLNKLHGKEEDLYIVPLFLSRFNCMFHKIVVTNSQILVKENSPFSSLNLGLLVINMVGLLTKLKH